MANPSKITLYVVVRTDKIKTFVKAAAGLSSQQLVKVLEKEAPLLLSAIQMQNMAGDLRLANDVKIPAALGEASEWLIYYIAPIVRIFRERGLKLDVEVMFNEPSINRMYKEGYIDKWRKKGFYSNPDVKRLTHPEKWAVFDTTLQALEGKICYTHNETMKRFITNFKRKPDRRQPDDYFIRTCIDATSISSISGARNDTGGVLLPVPDGDNQEISQS